MIEPQKTTRAESAPKTYKRRWSLVVVYAVSLVGFSLLVAYGWDYYTTPLVERPHHEQYWDLKPGGSLGRAYGIVGASLMTLMLVYSLRKRVRAFRRIGQLRGWLDFHIYCGVMGPLLIVLHSSLKVTGIVALSFWSMVLVAASGVIGRYLYLQIPRRRSGDEMSLAEIQQVSEELSTRLMSQYGVSEKALHRLDGIVRRTVEGSASLVTILATLPFGSARLQWQVKALTRGMSTDHRAELQKLLQDRALLSRRLLLWERLQELFHHWHVFHKPFAIIMYIFAAVHIGVAIATGYGFS
jgi:hypothetical protein